MGRVHHKVQKIMIEREADLEYKQKPVRSIAGVDDRENVLE
jgi:hypothetical protein